MSAKINDGLSKSMRYYWRHRQQILSDPRRAAAGAKYRRTEKGKAAHRAAHQRRWANPVFRAKTYLAKKRWEKNNRHKATKQHGRRLQRYRINLTGWYLRRWCRFHKLPITHENLEIARNKLVFERSRKFFQLFAATGVIGTGR